MYCCVRLGVIQQIQPTAINNQPMSLIPRSVDYEKCVVAFILLPMRRSEVSCFVYEYYFNMYEVHIYTPELYHIYFKRFRLKL